MAAKSNVYHPAIKLSELKCQNNKARVTVEDRVIALFYVNGEVHAMDHFCYHAGGPLSIGDIEDSHGRICVVCPWHKHIITLDTGESLYTAVDPRNPRIQKPNCSKGVKQRLHHARIEGDTVYVKVSELKEEVESDRYYGDEYKEFMKNALLEPMLINKDAVKVPIHSSRKHLN